MRILAIIPAFNEEANIEYLINEFNKITKMEVDILIINDSSTDNTSAICRNLGVQVIDLPCNLGIGGAVQTGYKYAYRNNYDIAIQVDGDGQHKPEYIETLITPLLRGQSDIVIGSRYLDKVGFQSTLYRRWGIKYFSHLIRLLTREIVTDPTSGFRACNSKVIKLFSNRYPTDYPEPESIIHLKRNRLRIIEVPVVMRERVGGVSSINLSRSVFYMIKVSLAMLIDVLRKHTA